MNEIRLVLGQDVDFLWRTFGDAIKRHTDMIVVGEYDEPLELLVALKDIYVDVVFLCTRHGKNRGLKSHIMSEFPAVTLVLVDEELNDVFIESLRPVKRRLFDASSDLVLDSIRNDLCDLELDVEKQIIH